jgi:hypothetical protein
VPETTTAEQTARMLSDFCRLRVSQCLAPRETQQLQAYLLKLLAYRRNPARRGRGLHWSQIAQESGIDEQRLRLASKIIQFATDALDRALRALPAELPPQKPQVRRSSSTPRKPARQVRTATADGVLVRDPKPSPPRVGSQHPAESRRRGVRPRKVVEFPEPLFNQWDEPADFHDALNLHMRRFGDSYWHLHRAVTRPGDLLDRKTIQTWQKGYKTPQTIESFRVLGRIEQRYRLPDGYFRSKLPHPSRSAKGHKLIEIGPAERRRLAWHLPDDFDAREAKEQEAILHWVRTVVVSGATEYRRFQAAAMKHRYAIRFPPVADMMARPLKHQALDDDDREDDDNLETDPDILRGSIDAPALLMEEMSALIRFKTANLAAFGFQRSGVWGDATAAQKVEHLGLLFGALAASPRSAVEGFGLPLDALTFGLLVFPSIWDWYLQWRERRRGFYTQWEVDMLRVSLAFTRTETGWLRQSPHLADRVQAIPGLLTADEISMARADWAAACDRFHKHATNRAKEVDRIARVHRDPFEPILPILEAPSPVGEYRKITEEILRLAPNPHRYPKAAAEAARSFLMLRFGLHLGLRQKNLRQLLVCPRSAQPTPERRLEDLKRGELRWSDRDHGWEVLVPSVAFKNAHSSYFAKKPFRLVLPNLSGFYDHIDSYVSQHRNVLLGGAEDPGTFFVKTAKVTSQSAEYDQNTFYEAWRLVIQRYGVYNPYTRRGAIRGLLPHGPHNVRDVLATHILKQTGSYEQASYAIQDTPDTVAQHYGRFLPQDKAALAAQILNKVWEAD